MEKDNFNLLFNFNFWEIGINSYHEFFNELEKIKAQSLQLSRQVLDERNKFQCLISGLLKDVQIGLRKKNEIRKIKLKVEEFQSEIQENKDFEIEVEVPKQRIRKMPPGHYVTNCSVCHCTCHDDCPYPNNEEKIKCKAFDNNGFCTVCPGKCRWDAHVNDGQIYEMYFVKEKKTIDELKEKYILATDEKNKAEAMIKNIENELNGIQTNVDSKIKEAKICLNQLSQIAAKRNPLSIVDNIEVLIRAEENEKKPQWNEGVEFLKKAKEEAELLQKIEKNQSVFQNNENLIKKQNFQSLDFKTLFVK